jgi:hypothetical protein
MQKDDVIKTAGSGTSARRPSWWIVPAGGGRVYPHRRPPGLWPPGEWRAARMPQGLPQMAYPPQAAKGHAWAAQKREQNPVARFGFPIATAKSYTLSRISFAHKHLEGISRNVWILLANLLQGSRSTFSRANFPSFFAFKEGMWDTHISALWSSPTVSVRLMQHAIDPSEKWCIPCQRLSDCHLTKHRLINALETLVAEARRNALC